MKKLIITSLLMGILSQRTFGVEKETVESGSTEALANETKLSPHARPFVSSSLKALNDVWVPTDSSSISTTLESQEEDESMRSIYKKYMNRVGSESADGRSDVIISFFIFIPS